MNTPEQQVIDAAFRLREVIKNDTYLGNGIKDKQLRREIAIDFASAILKHGREFTAEQAQNMEKTVNALQELSTALDRLNDPRS